MAKFQDQVEKGLIRIPVTINVKTENWLQKLRIKMKSTGGSLLPRTYLIRGILKALMKIKINVDGVKTEEEFTKRVMESINKR